MISQAAKGEKMAMYVSGELSNGVKVAATEMQVAMNKKKADTNTNRVIGLVRFCANLSFRLSSLSSPPINVFAEGSLAKVNNGLSVLSCRDVGGGDGGGGDIVLEFIPGSKLGFSEVMSLIISGEVVIDGEVGL